MCRSIPDRLLHPREHLISFAPSPISRALPRENRSITFPLPADIPTCLPSPLACAFPFSQKSPSTTSSASDLSPPPSYLEAEANRFAKRFLLSDLVNSSSLSILTPSVYTSTSTDQLQPHLPGHSDSFHQPFDVNVSSSSHEHDHPVPSNGSINRLDAGDPLDFLFATTSADANGDRSSGSGPSSLFESCGGPSTSVAWWGEGGGERGGTAGADGEGGDRPCEQQQQQGLRQESQLRAWEDPLAAFLS
jgi:hypothetical protein